MWRKDLLMNEILTLDFGGSALKYALLNVRQEFSESGVMDAPKSGMEEFTNCVTSLYEKFKHRISGIAIALAGTLDSKSGYVFQSSTYTFMKEINLVEILNEKCPIPITLANDSNSAAMAEMNYGCLQGVSHAIVIILGSAIGGTIIHNGEIYQGKHFSAAEFSLLKTNGNDDGLDYIWAKKNGSNGLMRLVQKYKGTDKRYSGIEIFNMANQGDTDVIDAVDEFCRHLAVQIYNLQTIFDTERIAIGGGISAQPLLFELLDEYLNDIFRREEPFALTNVKPDVVPCKYQNNANLLGAYHHYVSKYGGQ
ncbi:ROK family protein [Paenibacillus sp. DMB5]|uniref:ROK family protein n=1 Tax=Paenibacillus sp. DMB5 TaxID=1780103 RepID=UPI00076C5A36|nr:ROK family protein [Paenibacillus sp. DMB5]KUP25917.1 hypothetical protein AWJ19_33410 [Paenibacillus sp. DMB5]